MQTMQPNRFFLEKIQRKKVLGLEIPFQSVQHTFSLLLFSIIGAIIIGLIIKFITGKDFPLVVLCGILIILPLMYSVLPLKLTVTCRSQNANYWIPKIEENVRLLGYRDCYISNNFFSRYRLNHPHWLRVKENEFEIYRETSSLTVKVVIIGPASMVEQLKIKLCALEE